MLRQLMLHLFQLARETQQLLLIRDPAPKQPRKHKTRLDSELRDCFPKPHTSQSNRRHDSRLVEPGAATNPCTFSPNAFCLARGYQHETGFKLQTPKPLNPKPKTLNPKPLQAHWTQHTTASKPDTLSQVQKP